MDSLDRVYTISDIEKIIVIVYRFLSLMRCFGQRQSRTSGLPKQTQGKRKGGADSLATSSGLRPPARDSHGIKMSGFEGIQCMHVSSEAT